jgi:hypothetical protein
VPPESDGIDVRVTRLEDDHRELRKKHHDLRDDYNGFKLTQQLENKDVKASIANLAEETRRQTPLIKDVHLAVVGDNKTPGLIEKQRNSQRWINNANKLLWLLIAPVLGALAVALLLLASKVAAQQGGLEHDPPARATGTP